MKLSQVRYKEKEEQQTQTERGGKICLNGSIRGKADRQRGDKQEERSKLEHWQAGRHIPTQTNSRLDVMTSKKQRQAGSVPRDLS